MADRSSFTSTTLPGKKNTGGWLRCTTARRTLPSWWAPAGLRVPALRRAPCHASRAQVYDITSQSSFAALQSWVKELRENGPDGAVISVCGNKVDCESSRVRRLRGLLLGTLGCVCMPLLSHVCLPCSA